MYALVGMIGYQRILKSLALATLSGDISISAIPSSLLSKSRMHPQLMTDNSRMPDNSRTRVFRIIALIEGWWHIKVITSPGAKLLYGCGFVAATVTGEA